MSGPVLLIPPFRQLVEGVTAYFLELEITTVVARGWKARNEQINQGPGRANRVIFAGSKPDGSAGTCVGPRQVGWLEVGSDPEVPEYKIRPLSDWDRALYVSIWAYDGDKPNDEGAQDDAVYQLFTLVQRAVQSVGFGNPVWGSTNFTVPLERAFGLELLVELTFQTGIFDTPQEIARPSAAVIKGPLPPPP